MRSQGPTGHVLNPATRPRCHYSYLSSVVKRVCRVTWGTAASVREERGEV
jgi:hypothetical protein